MKRGILAALALLATMFVPAASAAPPPYVVYEIVRTGPGAYPTSLVRITARSAVLMVAALRPDDDGGGYVSESVWVSMASSDSALLTKEMRVDLRGGRRFIVGVPRGSASFYFASPHWAARETRLGFRVVTRAPGDETSVAGTPFETFRSAAAAGGAYGSVAFAEAPCEAGAGTYSFYREGEQGRVPGVCVAGGGWDFGEAREGTTWHLDGPVVGAEVTNLPYRLLVLDYPRR